MLFPLSKDFSGTSIFQRSGEHHERPGKRVWTVDHTGSKDRIKELHLLLTDQKPYAHHERLATKKANEGKKADADRLKAFREDLHEMHAKIDGEANERRQEMYRSIREFNQRRSASDSNLRQMLHDQAKEHSNFLNEMHARTWSMGPMWGGEPTRETAERTKMRIQASKDVHQGCRDYKQSIKDLKAELQNRGPQEWTAVPRPSNDKIQMQRKAAGIAKLTQDKEQYENFLDAMAESEHQRVLGERREMRMRAREAENRLSADKTKLLQSLNDTQTMKKAELDGIQARVNGRGAGHPAHPEFVGYCSAGYAPVEKGSKRLMDQRAEAADKDADHGESAAKLLCLSMPLTLRNKIVQAKNPKNKASLLGTGIDNPMDWTAMSWTQRWALISTHAPPNAVRKAEQKAGVSEPNKGLDMTATANSVADQRTLSPRTLGLASS